MSTSFSEYRLGSSRAYAVFTLLVHAGAAISVASADVPVFFVAAAIALLAMNLRRDLCLWAWRSAARAVTAVRIEHENWLLLQRDGTAMEAGRPRAVRLALGAMVITFATPRGRGFRLLVPPDALAAQDLRRLRAHGLAARRSGAS